MTSQRTAGDRADQAEARAIMATPQFAAAEARIARRMLATDLRAGAVEIAPLGSASGAARWNAATLMRRAADILDGSTIDAGKAPR